MRTERMANGVRVRIIGERGDLARVALADEAHLVARGGERPAHRGHAVDVGPGREDHQHHTHGGATLRCRWDFLSENASRAAAGNGPGNFAIGVTDP